MSIKRNTMARFFYIGCLLASLALGAKNTQMSLQQALDAKLLEVKITNLKMHSFCIQMSLKNLSKDSLTVMVEPGRRLNSLDDDVQDFLVVKQAVFVLKAQQLKSMELKGYCCQASKGCPPKDAKYSANTLADSQLVKLARFLDKWQFDRGAEQEAVWAISDKYSVAGVSSGNDSLTRSLREMVALLKEEELPWYRILSKTYLCENGRMFTVNLRLQGLMSYSNDKENYITLSVKNEGGREVCQLKSEWAKVCTNELYKLDLPIKDLPKGKYKIELRSPEKQLAQREFEL